MLLRARIKNVESTSEGTVYQGERRARSFHCETSFEWNRLEGKRVDCNQQRAEVEGCGRSTLLGKGLQPESELESIGHIRVSLIASEGTAFQENKEPGRFFVLYH